MRASGIGRSAGGGEFFGTIPRHEIRSGFRYAEPNHGSASHALCSKRREPHSPTSHVTSFFCVHLRMYPGPESRVRLHWAGVIPIAVLKERHKSLAQE